MIRKYKHPRIYICDRLDYYFGDRGTWKLKQELMEPAIRDLPFLDEFDLLNKIDIKEWRCVIDDTTMLDEEEMMDRFMEESINSMIDRINFLLELSKTK